ncbi:MAG: hypothetical protein Kow0025_17310 [Thermodesulfovibrionales bacterium]
MHNGNLLEKQVKAELKRRKYIFYTLVLSSLIYILWNLASGDMSIMRYTELREKEAALGSEVAELKKENERVRSVIGSYRDNDFFAEKHAREEFGLAAPDEYIFLYKNDQ